jgi:hypothetical protein
METPPVSERRAGLRKGDPVPEKGSRSTQGRELDHDTRRSAGISRRCGTRPSSAKLSNASATSLLTSKGVSPNRQLTTQSSHALVSRMAHCSQSISMLAKVT